MSRTGVALDVLVVCATPGEGEAIRRVLERRGERRVAGRPLVWGRLGGRRVGVLTAGMGKTNVGLALGAALEAAGPAAVGALLSVGVGGAYPGAGLEPGDLAVATEEIYGDEGVEGPQGFQGVEATGIPLWEACGRRFFNRFPADPGLAEGLARAATGVGRARLGPFVTVSTVTGSRRRARELERRWSAVCESLEGAAAAHAAAVFGVAFAEIRGVSNPVGPRDRAVWRLAEAAAAAQAAALAFLVGRPGPEPEPKP
ncbi:MAG: futalosine hydrolase [Deferrisomatales bacterium]